MSKRKRKSRRRLKPATHSSTALRSPRQSRQTLEAAFEQADILIARGQAQEAIDLLEPYVAAHPRESELQYLLGYAHTKAGDLWEGLASYERAIELGGDLGISLPLGALYIEAEMPAHAMRVWRPALAQADADPMTDHMRETVQEIEQAMIDMAQELGLEPEQAQEAKYQMEVGQRALSEKNYSTAIAAERRAIRLLGDWPPPHNNLAMALFSDGQPDQAISICRKVIEQDANNVHALGNAIRFLAWTGREAEARPLWDRLRGVTPRVPSDVLKVAEAAADLNEDESVYQALNPPNGPPLSQAMRPRYVPGIELMLAIAEANTGRRRQAIHRLEALQPKVSGLEDYLTALRAGKPGPGWAERFPYVSLHEMLPSDEMETFVNLVGGQKDIQEPRFRRQVERFVARYPQIVRVAEKIIWETELPDLGIALLAVIPTPAAHAALRRFALSQAGEDDARMRALRALGESGGLDGDEWVRVWLNGEWQQVRVREYELVEEAEFDYAEQVADLLNQGLAAMQAKDDEEAERLYRQALALEPQARQAYNNLGVIYRQRGEEAQARAMFKAALEADPTYAFPRCSLANDLIDEGDIDGAEEMLAPLRDVTRLQPTEMSFYTYTQARILIRQGEYDRARQALRTALRFTPGYEPAQELIERIAMISRIRTGFDSLMERTRARKRSTRARLQTELSVPDPTLIRALPLYTKDALTHMARVVLPWGGWSALRKAELIAEIIAGLQDADNLLRIVDNLEQNDRTALHQVLADGGSMPWAKFDAAYGNDLDESPYGNFARSKTTMGRLRGCGLLAETTVGGELRVAIPADLRAELLEILK